MIEALLSPDKLWTRDEVLVPGARPRRHGAYGWYFDRMPPGVHPDGCHRVGAFVLLAAECIPEVPSSTKSRRKLAYAIRNGYAGTAATSSLRLHLGCLLSSQLGLMLRWIDDQRMTFGTHKGETLLSAWMARHVRVAWVEHRASWELAGELDQLVLPLSLTRPHPFHTKLAAIVEEATAQADAVPRW